MSRESLEELRERLLRNEHAQELIRMRAFEIYKLRGGVSGSEAHDWFQAESEVLTFLIDEESRRASESHPPDATGDSSGAVPTPAAVAPSKPAKRAAPKAAAARKPKEAGVEKATTKRGSKKPADSSQNPGGRKKKD
jgi:hypothetical protein